MNIIGFLNDIIFQGLRSEASLSQQFVSAAMITGIAITAIGVGKTAYANYASRRNIAQEANPTETLMPQLARLISPQGTNSVHTNDPQVVLAIRVFENIRPDDREAFVEQALRLITPDMGAQERIGILVLLAGMQTDETDDLVTFIGLISRLITPDMSAHDRVGIIRSLAGIQPDKRGSFVGQTSRLITQGMSTQDRIGIVNILIWIQGNFDVFDKIGVFRAVSELPVNERCLRLERAHAQFLVERGGEMGAARFTELLNHPLDQPFGRVIPRDIDIHTRDPETRVAMELLREHQGEISPDQINTAVREFQEYLTAQPAPTDDERACARKALALYVLQGPRGTESFSAFLGEQDEWAVYGLVLTGEEVIARLWIHANKSLTGDDIEGAKQGMIGGLIRSFQGESRVCNPGKTQQLFQAALQGYLPGVVLDQEAAGQTSAEFMAAALTQFTQARQEIDNAADLVIEALIWLPQNPNIQDRAQFFEQLREYMNHTYPPIANRDEFLAAAARKSEQLPQADREALNAAANEYAREWLP